MDRFFHARRGEQTTNRFGVVLVRATPVRATQNLPETPGEVPLARGRDASSPGVTASGCLIGSCTSNALPCPSRLFTQFIPPCRSTTSLQNVRPRPELRTRGVLPPETCP